MKKAISMAVILGLILCLFAGCNGMMGNDPEEETGKVYYLNFKPEADADWQALAAKYTDKTGVEVKVVTAASGDYEKTLGVEIEKANAPTMFQVNGPVGLSTWKDYALDISDSDIRQELISEDFALKEGDIVYGIAFVYEAYGLITNKKLLKEAGYELEDIKDFASLKAAAEDIHSRADELGFDAFTSSGLDGSSSWRFSGHLTNLPLYYEFTKDNVTEQPATIKGTYLDNFKAVWDMYIQNSATDPKTLTSKTGDDAVAEFKEGKAVFYQNGTWEFANASAIGEENIGYLPIYFGVDDAAQGLCAGTENYWVVNSQVSEADQKATLDFMKWLATDEEATKALASGNMGFTCPFKSAQKPENGLYDILNDMLEEGKTTSVKWMFPYTPNTDAWRAEVVSALSAYSAGTGDWELVENAIVDGWATQYNASHQ
ncbi:MAG: ABC transporter substrate-binding protein [Clostridia bacterium]|nr:ABC transporter substrate-binding protein [Clostridia bacterium]